MLHIPTFPGRCESVYYNDSTPVWASRGVSVVAGASYAEGSWTASGLGALTEDIYALDVKFYNSAVATWGSYTQFDIGIDLAGGTSYTETIIDIYGGQGSTTSGLPAGCVYTFPYFIPSGATLGVRAFSMASSPGTCYCCITAYGKPAVSHLFPKCTHVEGRSAAVTPGNAGWGSWASIGATLTYPGKWLQSNYDIAGGTVTAETTYFQIAVGDGSNKEVLQQLAHLGNTSEYRLYQYRNENLVPWRAGILLPVGAQIYARARTNNSPDTGYYVGVHVFG